MRASLCQATYWPSIELVPAGAILAQAEESLSRRSANGRLEPVLYFDELASFLAAVSDRYDVAVIDTRPDVNMLMTIALHAATGLVVPARMTMTDLASTGEFFAHLASYVADFRKAFGTRFSHQVYTIDGDSLRSNRSKPRSARGSHTRAFRRYSAARRVSAFPDHGNCRLRQGNPLRV